MFHSLTFSLLDAYLFLSLLMIYVCHRDVLGLVESQITKCDNTQARFVPRKYCTPFSFRVKFAYSIIFFEFAVIFCRNLSHYAVKTGFLLRLDCVSGRVYRVTVSVDQEQQAFRWSRKSDGGLQTNLRGFSSYFPG